MRCREPSSGVGFGSPWEGGATPALGVAAMMQLHLQRAEEGLLMPRQLWCSMFLGWKCRPPDLSIGPEVSHQGRGGVGQKLT